MSENRTCPDCGHDVFEVVADATVRYSVRKGGKSNDVTIVAFDGLSVEDMIDNIVCAECGTPIDTGTKIAKAGEAAVEAVNVRTLGVEDADNWSAIFDKLAELAEAAESSGEYGDYDSARGSHEEDALETLRGLLGR